jgi:hypothetical protein
MNNTATTGTKFLAGALAACVFAGAGCMADPTLEDSEAIASESAAVTSPEAVPPVTAEMQYLAHLPADKFGEEALAKLFANGTATYVPTGNGTGYPVLFHSVPELNWLAGQLWGGKTFRVISAETHPNGDPIVALDNKIIKTPTGGLLNLFDAYVTRTTIADLDIGTNDKGQKVLPPKGTLPLVPVSFLHNPVVIDDKPSVVLNYFGDKTLPVIRRILDEVREVDGANCKGLYLGRAHARRCVSWNCGELPSLIVDFPEQATFDTRYEWGFWTYFLLNFGQPEGQTCDISKAIATAEAQLKADGLNATLPPLPAKAN